MQVDNDAILKDEFKTILQWFETAQDVNPGYLEQKDYKLAIKIYTYLGRQVPSSVRRGAA
jgi:hypothetical protein